MYMNCLIFKITDALTFAKSFFFFFFFSIEGSANLRPDLAISSNSSNLNHLQTMEGSSCVWKHKWQ